ncbi:hypothetical protein ON010_g7970 [Phytophthora cinnamomi]|nr:hypothetical protein ON010_g7970 [Phytophthora cinnamomi]
MPTKFIIDYIETLRRIAQTSVVACVRRRDDPALSSLLANRQCGVEVDVATYKFISIRKFKAAIQREEQQEGKASARSMDALHAQKENVDVRSGGVAGKLNFAAEPPGRQQLRWNPVYQEAWTGEGSWPLEEAQCQEAEQDTVEVQDAVKARTTASLKSVTVTKPPQAEEVPDVEFAYGGLPSPTSDSAYMKGLRDEIVRDILNDKTPTLFDEFDPAQVVDAWDDGHEKAMLESGEPPSPWWASVDPQKEKESQDVNTTEELEHEEDDLSVLPPPDNLPGDTRDNFDDDGLLEDLLSVDVEAACSE